MKSHFKVVLPLLATALAIGMAPTAAMADNPITKPGWAMPQAGRPGNFNTACDPGKVDSTQLAFGDCFSQNTLFLRLTGDPTGEHPPRSAMYFLEDLVQTKLLQSDSGSGAQPTFVNFLDLTIKRFMDGDTSTTLDYNPNNYLYRPVTAAVGPFSGPNRTIGTGGYEASPLLDQTCLDIPLVGSVCLHGYLYDVDNEAGSVFFEYNHLNPVFELRPRSNGDVESGNMNPAGDTCVGPPCTLVNNLTDETQRDDDDGLEVRLRLEDVALDLFFEPPTDTTLVPGDGKNDAANYEPSEDLSNYVKAYGKARLGVVELVLNLRITSNYNDGVQPHSIGVGFELQDVYFNSDFQFVFQKGPYCNNNLRTTETPAAGATHLPAAWASERPFMNNAGGTPNFPGLVSETAGTYYAQQAPAYPVNSGTGANNLHTAPGQPANGVNANPYRGGGSGAGRDRIGIGAAPYEYNTTDNRYSDHPMNCRKPADACDVTVASGTANPVQHGGPEWTGTTALAGCEYPNVSNNSDDATYKISEQITSIIPFIQGEIKVIAEDKFKNRSRGNPGYYLGPTSLIDLGATLAGISFDWPLRPGTDYVFLDALLDSDVDGDSTSEFWADDWGVMLPFNFALGVSWNTVPEITAAVADRLDPTACVQELATLTGYKDGFGEFVGGLPANGVNTNSLLQDASDDPFLSRTFANKALATAGLQQPDRGVLAGFGFPAVTGPTLTAPGVYQPAGSVIDPDAGGPAVAADSYAIGFAIHQNVLSAALYDAVLKGLLCLDLDASGQYANVDDQLLGSTMADLLNTSTFQMFFPALYDNFPDRPMRMRMVPLLQRYNHANISGGDFAFPGGVTSVVNGLDHLQPSEAPYVVMGGPQISLDLVNNGAGDTIYPDLSIVIPNLLLEFYVYGDASGSNTWHRVFAIDMGIAIGLNIDIVRQPSVFANLPNLNTGTDQYGRPFTGQTYFPIGCNPAAVLGDTDFCSGGSAYTMRVLRLAGLADPEINAIIEYSELTFGKADGTESTPFNICGDDAVTGPTVPFEPGDTACVGGMNRPVDDAFTNPAILKGAISNLIGLALSVDINALVEVGFDLGAFLNIPVAIDAPFIGPSYVDGDGALGTADNMTDREENSGGVNGNGFGDYLVGGVSVDLSALSADYLIQQINYLLDGTDSTQPFGLDLDLGLAPKTPTFAEAIPVPQATIQAPVKVSAQESIFRFSGYDAADGANVKYSWRVDNGVWTNFSKSNQARVVGLLEGKHTIEVKAINSQNMMQDMPARYTFVVDSIAPKVRVVGDRSVGRRASFFVEANDWLTPKEDVRVAYRLDDGRWTNFSYNKKISLSGLREGRHTLRVRASDNTGNTAETAFNFSASDGGFGCSTAGSGSMADLLVMLVVPALFFLRKRMF